MQSDARPQNDRAPASRDWIHPPRSSRLQNRVGSHTGSAFFDEDRSPNRQARVCLPRTWSSCAAMEVLVILFFQAMFMLLAYDILSTLCRFQIIYSMVKSWKIHGKTDGPGIVD